MSYSEAYGYGYDESPVGGHDVDLVKAEAKAHMHEHVKGEPRQQEPHQTRAATVPHAYDEKKSNQALYHIKDPLVIGHKHRTVVLHIFKQMLAMKDKALAHKVMYDRGQTGRRDVAPLQQKVVFVYGCAVLLLTPRHDLCIALSKVGVLLLLYLYHHCHAFLHGLLIGNLLILSYAEEKSQRQDHRQHGTPPPHTARRSKQERQTTFQTVGERQTGSKEKEHRLLPWLEGCATLEAPSCEEHGEQQPRQRQTKMVGHHHGKHDVGKGEEQKGEGACLGAGQPKNICKDAVGEDDRIDSTHHLHGGHDEDGTVDACDAHEPLVKPIEGPEDGEKERMAERVEIDVLT